MKKRILRMFNFNNIIIILLFLFLFFLLHWNGFNAPFERDEGEYAYSAWILSSGKGVPYKDSFLQKPPMIIYTYLLSYIVNPDAVWPSRVLAGIFIVASALLVHAIVKKDYDEKLAWISAFLTIIVLSAPFYNALAANTELFLITPLLAVVYIYMKYKEEARGYEWFISGVLTAISLLYKPIGLYPFIYIYGVWIYSSYKARKGWYLIIKNVSSMLLGGLITAAIILLPFILKGAWNYFLESAVFYNAYYAKMWGLNLSGFQSQMARLIKYWWILLFLFAAFFLKKGKNGNFYLGLFVVSILAVFQSVIAHYYLIILPFLVILSVIGIKNISDLVSKTGKNISIIFLAVITVMFMLWPIRAQFGLTPKQVGLWVYGTESPFNEADIVAREVAKITNQNDKIFVGGSEPEIYYYAKRVGVSRFVITYPLNLNTELREKYQREAVEDLQNNNPDLVVISQLHMSGLWDKESPRIFIDYFINLINNNYKPVGGYVRGTSGGFWSENLTKSELQNSSLLIYKKI